MKQFKPTVLKTVNVNSSLAGVRRPTKAVVVPTLQLNKVACTENAQPSTFRSKKPPSARVPQKPKSKKARPISARRPSKKALETERLPTDPGKALKAFKSHLSAFELTEILHFDCVYFVPIGVTKHKARKNGGFDDEAGDYLVLKKDHIAYRFEVIKLLGKGSFGQVLKVYDHKLKQTVALKVLRNRENIFKQGQIEVKIMELLASQTECQSVGRFKEAFIFRGHQCYTMELLHINLYELIKANNFRGLSLPLIRRFATQLLQALVLTENLGVIHCDLKPENILLTAPNKSTIKVIDFGTSCFVDQTVFTYIQSRFYRAPEIILGLPYNTKIDVWSFGCILFELYTGYPLFPGRDETDLLKHIMRVCGLPPLKLLEKATRTRCFFDSRLAPKIYTARDKGLMPGARRLQEQLKGTNSMFIDFLEKTLEWASDYRPAPSELLKHPWILAGEAKVVASTPRNKPAIKVYRHNSMADAVPKTTKHSYNQSFYF